MVDTMALSLVAGIGRYREIMREQQAGMGGDGEMPDDRRASRVCDIDAYIRDLVARAPVLAPAQRDRLALLFCSAGTRMAQQPGRGLRNEAGLAPTCHATAGSSSAGCSASRVPTPVCIEFWPSSWLKLVCVDRVNQIAGLGEVVQDGGCSWWRPGRRRCRNPWRWR